jgi:hypothetical protein
MDTQNIPRKPSIGDRIVFWMHDHQGESITPWMDGEVLAVATTESGWAAKVRYTRMPDGKFRFRPKPPVVAWISSGNMIARIEDVDAEVRALERMVGL